MAKYIRCMKSNGHIVGSNFESKPIHLPHNTVFWVSCGDSLVFPEKYFYRDEVLFALTVALSSAELSATNLLKDEADGLWQHTKTQAEANADAIQKRIEEIDRETFDLIKAWCAGESERVEEAFLSLGIGDVSDVRFQLYQDNKQSLIASQQQKKVDEGLIA